MSLTKIEFAVRRMRRGQCQAQHGPYDTLDEAEQKRKDDEGDRVMGASWWTDRWIIVERDVSDWIVMPTEEPPSTKSAHWPEED
jgi:hypothetical protein